MSNNRSILALPNFDNPIDHAVALQTAAASVGFDWTNHQGVIDKIKEELEEVIAEIELAQPERLQDEIGDLLFSCINLARHLGVDIHRAITSSNDKFCRRFHYIEQHINVRYQSNWSYCSSDELNKLWQQAKEQ